MRLASFTGMAKPISWPWLLMAVFMPITSPCKFTSGPPLLPGLIAASVWNTPSSCSEEPRLSPATTLRPMPEITPLVTVLRYSPRALPMAITVCPICTESESPKRTAGILLS